jgi:hypothetical protein
VHSSSSVGLDPDLEQEIKKMSNGSVSRPSKDLLTPSMTSTVLKYHSTPPSRLVELTTRDLTSCGIPARALGRVSDAFHVTLVGCVAVNDHARSYLPAALGGTADDLDASADTTRLSEASFARSPGARLRAPPASPAAAPAAPPPLPPSTPSRAALLRAATDAVDAAEAAEEDAAGAVEASEAATRRRNEAATVLRGVERRHTRAHPRGSLVAGSAEAGGSGRRGRLPTPLGGTAAVDGAADGAGTSAESAAVARDPDDVPAAAPEGSAARASAAEGAAAPLAALPPFLAAPGSAAADGSCRPPRAGGGGSSYV